MSKPDKSLPNLKGISLPDWVRFIAQDSDGSWWGYSVDPLQNHRGWYENELGQNIKLIEGEGGTVIRDEIWKNSLKKV